MTEIRSRRLGLADTLTGARSQPHDQETMKWLWARASRTGTLSRWLSGHYTQRLWFTPWPTAMSSSAEAREKAWLASVSSLEVEFEGRVLHGFTAGDGPAVLLVHGWGEHAARLGAFIEPLTAAGLRAVGVTMPAHGPGARGRTNVYEMARAVATIGARVGGVDAIIAHSMGVTASALARRAGLPCKAMVAMAVPTMRTEDAFDGFGQLLGFPTRTMVGLRRAIERRFGASTWQDVADALGHHPNVPALVIHDRHDPLVPQRDAEAVAAAWGVPLRKTSELGHRRILRDPAIVAEVVAFLAAALLPGEVVDQK